MFEDLCFWAWGIREGLNAQKVRMRRAEAKASAALRHQSISTPISGWRRGRAWDTLSCVHGVLAGAQFCTLLALVGGCLKNRKVSSSFSGHFCSGRRNKALSEVSSVPQVLIECRPWERNTLPGNNWRITAKWQMGVNRMKQDRAILRVLLWDANLQSTGHALTSKGFENQVAVDSWIQWLPPKGTWRKSFCSVTSLALSNARNEGYHE